MPTFDSVADLPPRMRAQVEAQLAERAKARVRRRATCEHSRVRGVETRELWLDVPCLPWSLNEERSAHWAVRDRRTKAVRLAAAALVPREWGCYDERVEIDAWPRGVVHDPGNDIGCVKAAVDGLRDAGVLVDDRSAQVARVILNAPIPGNPGLVLCVRVWVDPNAATAAN